MKKNLLSVFILALLIVNVVLTGIIMFSTVSANKKTIALVNDIATVLDLELTQPIQGQSTAGPYVSIENTDVYSIPDSMTIALKRGSDGKDHYCMCQVSFALNKGDDDYSKMQPMLEGQQNKIKSIIMNVVGEYSNDDAQDSKNKIAEEILGQVQAMFESRFIYEVYFSDFKVQ